MSWVNADRKHMAYMGGNLHRIADAMHRIADALDPPDDIPAPDTPAGKIAGLLAEKLVEHLSEKFTAGVADELANRVLKLVHKDLKERSKK